MSTNTSHDALRKCHDCGYEQGVYVSDPSCCNNCGSRNVTDDPDPMTPDESARERVARELYAQYFDWNSNEKIEREARDAWDGKGCEPVGEKTKEHYRKRADRILDALEGESGRPGLGDALYGMVMANLHGDRARDLIYEEYRTLHDTPSEGGGEGDTYQVCAVPYPNPETVGWDAQCCRRKGHDGQHAVSQEGLFWGRDPTDRPEATEEGERVDESGVVWMVDAYAKARADCARKGAAADKPIRCTDQCDQKRQDVVDAVSRLRRTSTEPEEGDGEVLRVVYMCDCETQSSVKSLTRRSRCATHDEPIKNLRRLRNAGGGERRLRGLTKEERDAYREIRRDAFDTPTEGGEGDE